MQDNTTIEQRPNKTKLLIALFMTALSCVGATACETLSGGPERPSITSSTTHSSQKGPVGHTRTLPPPFGDYDDDDYRAHNRFGDGDNDDSGGPKDGDGDTDNNSHSYYDADDETVRAYGHAASKADRRAVISIVHRYFRAAATGDGMTGCTLLYGPVAKAVPHDQGRPPGPSYLHGNTCSKVMSKLFKRNHRQLKAYASTLQVTSVRLDNGSGLAVLGFHRLPGRLIAVQRQGHTWKIDALHDNELP